MVNGTGKDSSCLLTLEVKHKDKPEWLLMAETLKPNAFIEWMHRNKSYKKDKDTHENKK